MTLWCAIQVSSIKYVTRINYPIRDVTDLTCHHIFPLSLELKPQSLTQTSGLVPFNPQLYIHSLYTYFYKYIAHGQSHSHILVHSFSPQSYIINSDQSSRTVQPSSSNQSTRRIQKQKSGQSGRTVQPEVSRRIGSSSSDQSQLMVQTGKLKKNSVIKF